MKKELEVAIGELLKTDNALIAWVVMMVWGCFGGLVAYIQRLKHTSGLQFSLAEVVGEAAISAFVALLAFSFCMSRDLDLYLSIAIVGISAHMGSRFIFICEKLVQEWIERVFPIK